MTMRIQRGQVYTCVRREVEDESVGHRLLSGPTLLTRSSP